MNASTIQSNSLPPICSISTPEQVDAEVERIDGQLKDSAFREDVHIALYEKGGKQPADREAVRQDMLDMGSAGHYKIQLQELKGLLTNVQKAQADAASAREVDVFKVLRVMWNQVTHLTSDVEDPSETSAELELSKANGAVADFHERLGVCNSAAPPHSPYPALPYRP